MHHCKRQIAPEYGWHCHQPPALCVLLGLGTVEVAVGCVNPSEDLRDHE